MINEKDNKNEIDQHSNDTSKWPVITNVMAMGDVVERETVTIKVPCARLRCQLEGDITWRRKKLVDTSDINVAASQFTKGNKLIFDDHEQIIRALSELSVVVEKYPSWWTRVIEELEDYGVVMAVYAEFVRWSNRPFLEERKRYFDDEKETGNRSVRIGDEE